MKFPWFFYVKKFWEGLAFIVAGLSVVLYVLGILPLQYVQDAGAVLLFFLAVLRFFGVEAEARAKGLK